MLKALNINSIKVYKLNFKSSSSKKTIYTFLKHLKTLNKLDIDLIFYYSVSPRDWLLFSLTTIYSKLKKIPLIYDYFISKFQTYYSDRKVFSHENKLFKLLKYAFLYCLDYFECLLSDKIILDTNTHIKYFNVKFNLRKNKFRRIFVGAEPIFRISNKLVKKREDNDKIKVGFWGTYIPLHGIEFIIKAANILKDDKRIIFSLLGRGQTYKKILELAESLKLKNLEFHDIVPLKQLPNFISECDIALGIFGKGEKALCVIPNKIFEAIQMKIPIITSNTPAINELLSHRENIFLCQRADPKSISEGILELVNNQELRFKIADNAYQVYKEKTCLKCISNDLARFFLEI
jgi:glycosyltransferase involved in cell wall biosynthesis